MRSTNITGVIGFGLLVAGIAFGMFDAKFSDHWYDWVFGPLFWMAGCALMIVWAVGRFLHLHREQGHETLLEYTQGHTPERRRTERRCTQRRKSAAAG